MYDLGMYVRCPIREDNEKIFRTFYFGQITEIDDETKLCKVEFHDLENIRDAFPGLRTNVRAHSNYLNRTVAMEKSVAIFKEKRVRLLGIASTPTNGQPFYEYYFEFVRGKDKKVYKALENELKISFTRAKFNPLKQALSYELHNPMWYLKRRIVSKSSHIIENSPVGFSSLLGTRVHLFPHQVDTIVRGLLEEPCRLMLADEVGLGKTIEALTIVKAFQQRTQKFKTLIIAPDSLVYQWQNELSYKYWNDAPIWGVENYDLSNNVLITTFSSFITDIDKIIASDNWDMLIVDETHRLLFDDSLYTKVLITSKKIPNLLLLSATPILNREKEYHKLLTLLNPTRFEFLDDEHFDDLISKQKEIREVIFSLMRDLSDYENYDLFNEYHSELERISENLSDPKLEKLISEIQKDDEDKGLNSIKVALAYISEFYQIERSIIRHRRIEIDEIGIKRKLIEIPYDMIGANQSYFESNVYDLVQDFAKYLVDHEKTELAQEIIYSFTSSPYALEELVHGFKKEYHYDFQPLEHYLNMWKMAVENEGKILKNNKIQELFGKLSHLVSSIEQADPNRTRKFIVFSNFTKTAEKIFSVLENRFGKGTVTLFTRKMNAKKMQESASLFQDNLSCRFIVCDESGGEGRNFQIADFIVHYDLPWTPALVEQRIGRLDRIGRDPNRDVVSIVIYSENTIENSIFRIFNEGLNIFTKSLCGMEIAFEQIKNSISNAFKADQKYGLSEVINEITSFSRIMSDEIEKERYFDLARQLDTDLRDKLLEIIDYFTKNDSEELMDTMMEWPEMCGFRGIEISDPFGDGSEVVTISATTMSEASMFNSLFVPPSLGRLISRVRYRNGICGTFSRTAAIKHEDLLFFAPFNPLFDAITKNAIENYKGRCCAFSYGNCKFSWTGLVLTWNVYYNPSLAFENGISSEGVEIMNRFMPTRQTITLFPFEGSDKSISASDIEEQLFDKLNIKPNHLGARDDGSIEKFKNWLTQEVWSKILKEANESGRKSVVGDLSYRISFESAKSALYSEISATRASRVYYDSMDILENDLDDEKVRTLLRGLKNPKIELDSIAFVSLVKQKRVV